MNNILVVLECNLDEYIVEYLGINSEQIIHQGGKGDVVNYLKNNQEGIGLIDEDPGNAQPNFLEKFNKIDKFGDLSLHKGGQFDITYIIKIKPRIEEWLLKRGKINNIDISTFGYSNNADDLHDIPKIETHKNFKNYIDAFLAEDDEA